MFVFVTDLKKKKVLIKNLYILNFTKEQGITRKFEI